MRLGEVLSKFPQSDYTQVDGFLLNKRGDVGQQIELSVGQIMLNYYCSHCEDVRTFSSTGKIYCIFVSKSLVSIDCVLTCGCGANVPVWFLIECDEDICSRAPNVRIIKRRDRLSSMVKANDRCYGVFAELLEKAECAYTDELGAGAIVYLRKIYEQITIEVATTAGILLRNEKGNRKPFKQLLKEVDEMCSIIPNEFSANGYRLFGELSEVIHGEYDEQMGLAKYEALKRLVIGILDNVIKRNEIVSAINSLGWNAETEGQ